MTILMGTQVIKTPTVNDPQNKALAGVGIPMKLLLWRGFPVDVWIGRALAELLPEGLPPSLAPCAGIAQQMIFHYMRACPDRAAAKAGEC